MCTKKIKKIFLLSLTVSICLALAAPADVWGAITGTVNVDGTDVDKTFRVVAGENPPLASPPGTPPQPWAIELFASQSDRGWSGPMPAGSERVLVKPLVLGGVESSTVIPDRLSNW